MRIEIINTGTELMLGYVLNTHQQWLCRQLSDHGYLVERQTAINDTGAAIQEAVREAMTRSDLIITTGGLGPTSDDLTRQYIAELLGVNLREKVEVRERIDGFFAKRNRTAPPGTHVQALIPEDATVFMNEHGTAPGLALEFQRGIILMLPGPPRELRPMFLDQALPLIRKRFPASSELNSLTLKSTGLGESAVEDQIRGPLASLVARGLVIGYCARVGEVDIRLSAGGGSGRLLVVEAEKIVQQIVGRHIFGMGDDTLESVVVHNLVTQRKTLALAESCTGGFMANRITNVPGASAVFLGSAVTYSNAAKEILLRVPEAILAQHGAVSKETAKEMAERARLTFKADYAISVTGIAGPSGGTAEKPVGTVYIAVADSYRTTVAKHLNQYDRETFKFVTSQQALEILRRKLIHPEPFQPR